MDEDGLDDIIPRALEVTAEIMEMALRLGQSPEALSPQKLRLWATLEGFAAAVVGILMDGAPVD